MPARRPRDVPMMMVTAMGVMPGMMAGMMGAHVPPCAVMRPCRSRSSGDGDCRRTQGQRDKRPAKRNKLNHTLSSVAAIPLSRPYPDDAAAFLFCDSVCGGRKILCGNSAAKPRWFHGNLMTKKTRCCHIAAASISCDFRGRRKALCSELPSACVTKTHQTKRRNQYALSRHQG